VRKGVAARFLTSCALFEVNEKLARFSDLACSWAIRAANSAWAFARSTFVKKQL
jgi:hypothetical protein